MISCISQPLMNCKGVFDPASPSAKKEMSSEQHPLSSTVMPTFREKSSSESFLPDRRHETTNYPRIHEAHSTFHNLHGRIRELQQEIQMHVSALNNSPNGTQSRLNDTQYSLIYHTLLQLLESLPSPNSSTYLPPVASIQQYSTPNQETGTTAPLSLPPPSRTLHPFSPLTPSKYPLGATAVLPPITDICPNTTSVNALSFPQSVGSTTNIPRAKSMEKLAIPTMASEKASIGDVFASDSVPKASVRNLPLNSKRLSFSPVIQSYISPTPKIQSSATPNEKNLTRNQCHICGKVCSRPSTLRTHVLVHTGVKPYPCEWPGCNRSFNVKSNMIRHYKNHEKKTKENQKADQETQQPKCPKV